MPTTSWAARFPVAHGNARTQNRAVPGVRGSRQPDATDHLILAVGNATGQFAKFCAVAGHPELAADPRYVTNQDRVRNRAELVPLLGHHAHARQAAAWLAALEQARCRAGHQQHRRRCSTTRRCSERDMVTTWNHRLVNPRLHLVRQPHPGSGATPVRTDRPPPACWASRPTKCCAHAAGLFQARIAALREGVI